MFVPSKTSGQAPFWRSASISVPGAPASSGLTFNQWAVSKPGREIRAPTPVVRALLRTSQPPSPTVVTPVDSPLSTEPVPLDAGRADGRPGDAAGEDGARAVTPATTTT